MVGDNPTNDPSSVLPDPNAVAQATDTLQRYGNTSSDVLPKIIELFKGHAAATEAAAKSLSIFNDIGTLNAKTSEILGTSISNNTEFFKRLGEMTSQQVNALSALSVGLLGASNLFEKMGNNRGLNTFSGQIKEIITSATGATSPIIALAKAMGLGNVDNKNFLSIKEQMLSMVNKFGDATDKSLNFSRSIFDLAAKTGQLNSLMQQAGPNLTNLGSLSANYAQKLNDIAAATNVDPRAMGEYYQLLGKVPGILDRQSSSSNNATNSMAALEKVIKLAHGTGQEFSEVINQLSLSWETYGLTGDKALNMTARMAELNRNFGINLEDTRGYITNMADTFKMLGDNTDSATSIFNKFFDGLRAGGLGIKPAIDTLQQMGSSLAHLSLAQKSFISSQTGGPGGLLGGIQIEKDLAAGRSADVLDRIRQAFTQRVGGRVMTRDDVQTQRDAAEFTRQRALLQSGAFGNIAKSDEQAAAILKAFASPASTKDRKAAEDVLKQSIQEGTNYEKLSVSVLQEISRKLDGIKIAGGFTGLRTVQQSITPLAGGRVGQAVESELAQNTARAIRPIDNADNSRERVREILGSIPRTFKEVMSGAEQLIKTFNEQFRTQVRDNRPVPQKEYDQKSQELIMALHQLRDSYVQTAKSSKEKDAILSGFKNMEDNFNKSNSVLRPSQDNTSSRNANLLTPSVADANQRRNVALPVLNVPPSTTARNATAATVSNTINNRRNTVNNVINQNATETRSSRVATAAGASVQARHTIRDPGILPALNAPPTPAANNVSNNNRTPERQTLTANINVYVDGKVKKTQQTVNLEGGVPEL